VKRNNVKENKMKKTKVSEGQLNFFDIIDAQLGKPAEKETKKNVRKD